MSNLALVLNFHAINLWATVAAAFAFLIAVGAWIANWRNRREIQRALGEMAIPESMLNYGASELEALMAKARRRQFGDGGDALALYVAPTLIPNDNIFAVAFAIFLAAANIAVAGLIPLQPFGEALAYLCAVMGLIYGVADVVENLSLARIFRGPTTVDPILAQRASTYTRLKFLGLFFAAPAILGLLLKIGVTDSGGFFVGFLKYWPLLVTFAAAVFPPFGRLLWECRVSVISAVGGYLLFQSVVQAQDLFADTRNYRDFSQWIAEDWPRWFGFYCALFFVWAVPVHWAARKTLEEAHPRIRESWRKPGRLAGLILKKFGRLKYDGFVLHLPRILGFLPVFAVMTGVLGAAIETRHASNLDKGLDPQYFALMIGAWITLGLLAFYFEFRRGALKSMHAYATRMKLTPTGFKKRIARSATDFLEGDSLTHIGMAITATAFLALCFAPIEMTHYLPRAILIPFLFGSPVLLLAHFARLGMGLGVPLLEITLFAFLAIGAKNAHFNDVRLYPEALKAETKPARLFLDQAAVNWRAANGCAKLDDPKKDEEAVKKCPPPLIVASDGGASRAAYFTGAVVGKIMDDFLCDPKAQSSESACPLRKPPQGVPENEANNAARAIFAMSGVSGGALGVATIKAALLDSRDGKPPCGASSSGEAATSWRLCLETLTEGDYLSPAFVGLGFRDPLTPVALLKEWGVPIPGWADRAAVLEQSWEDYYLSAIDGGGANCAQLEKRAAKLVGLCRPFAGAAETARWTPLLLLNGTSVTTGRRIIASELKPYWMKLREANAPCPTTSGNTPNEKCSTETLHQLAYDVYEMLGVPCKSATGQSCPRDKTADDEAKGNFRLSTAALLSARFPLVSPSGTIRAKDGTDGDSVVDGGYFENSGLTTARDIAAALHAVGLYPIIVSISNDPGPDAKQAAKPTSAQTNLVNSSRLPLGTATADSWGDRLVGMIHDPVAALYSTRDSHAEESARVLTEWLQEWDVPTELTRSDGRANEYVAFFPIRVFSKGYDVERGDYEMPDLSMSWWLSPVVRRALNDQLDKVANQMQLCLLRERLSRIGEPKLSDPYESSCNTLTPPGEQAFLHK